MEGMQMRRRAEKWVYKDEPHTLFEFAMIEPMIVMV